MFDGSPWALATVIGVIALAIAISYGMWKNSKRTAADRAVNKAANKREYQEEDDDRPDVHMPT
jgi:hypothetical protein